jgi:hypothetical protein
MPLRRHRRESTATAPPTDHAGAPPGEPIGVGVRRQRRTNRPAAAGLRRYRCISTATSHRTCEQAIRATLPYSPAPPATPFPRTQPLPYREPRLSPPPRRRRPTTPAPHQRQPTAPGYDGNVARTSPPHPDCDVTVVYRRQRRTGRASRRFVRRYRRLRRHNRPHPSPVPSPCRYGATHPSRRPQRRRPTTPAPHQREPIGARGTTATSHEPARRSRIATLPAYIDGNVAQQLRAGDACDVAVLAGTTSHTLPPYPAHAVTANHTAAHCHGAADRPRRRPTRTADGVEARRQRRTATGSRRFVRRYRRMPPAPPATPSRDPDPAHRHSAADHAGVTHPSERPPPHRPDPKPERPMKRSVRAPPLRPPPRAAGRSPPAPPGRRRRR